MAKWEWLYFAIPAVAGAVVGGIYYGVTKETPLSVPLAVVYGLLTAIVFFVLGEARRIGSRLDEKIANWELKVLDLQHLMPYLEKPDPFLKQQVSTSIDELRRLARGAAAREVVLKAHSIQRDCINILKLVQSGDDVFATSYVNPKFFWCTPEGELYRQQCIDLVQKGHKVTRVFIEPAVADDEERKCIEDEIEKQKVKGVRVKRVLEATLPEDCRKDFLLIPGKYAAYLDVGARGDILKELKVCFSAEELDKARSLADEIETLSTECLGTGSNAR